MARLGDQLRTLETVVGARHFLTATEEVSRYRVDGQQPVAVALPGSPEEVAAVLREAAVAGLSVLLRGAGRHTHMGAPAGPIGLVVSLARLDSIIEFDAENLTVTAQAGATLGALQEVVSERGLMLPLDPPGGDSATLGGIAAAGLSGLLRTRYGGPRDLVVGLRVALADGSLIKTGGKTVKNVAGYELGKLFLGSFGTLGAVCELTMRLSPQWEERTILAACLDPAAAAALARGLLGSSLDVCAVHIGERAAVARMGISLPAPIGEGEWAVFVSLAGDREAVARQVRVVSDAAEGRVTRLDGDIGGRAWNSLREVSYPRAVGEVVARVGAPVGSSAALLAQATEESGWWAMARAGDGLLHTGPRADDRQDQASVLARLSRLRAQAEQVRGYLVLESGPLELRRAIPVWGDAPNQDLMRRVKAGFDAKWTLGCGRYLPGL